MATVKVRVAVAVDTRGRYHAYGWSIGDAQGPASMDELLETVDYDTCGPGERLFWLTAELPVPETVEVVAVVEST